MSRVAVASIRDMGKFPCPRCLIPLSHVHRLGTSLDRKQRQSLARIDDHARRFDIKTAREIIYQKNYAVNSEHVEKILQGQSLVPNIVSLITKARSVG
jgi:hypothetical protein